MDPYPNAYTSGNTNCFITVTSGLIHTMNREEISAVLAHECAHIACHHVLYQTMAQLILNGGSELLDLGVLSLPLKLALCSWSRYAELSCDRAAAICSGGSDVVVDVMMRLSGASVGDDWNKKLYIAQSEEYRKYVDESSVNKVLQYFMIMNQTHPFTAVRADEIIKWCKQDRFLQMTGQVPGTGEVCPDCGQPLKPEWKFCRRCGSVIDKKGI